MTHIKFWTNQALETLRLPITSRLALTTSHDIAFPKIITILMAIINQLQILLIVLKPAILDIRAAEEDTSSQIIDTVYRYCFFEELESINTSTTTILWILGVICAYFLLQLSIVCYMSAMHHQKREIGNTTENIFNRLIWRHHLVFFYPINVLCAKVIYVSHQESLAFSSSSSKLIIIRVLSLLLITWNSTWCLLKIIVLTINVKTPHLFWLCLT